MFCFWFGNIIWDVSVLIDFLRHRALWITIFCLAACLGQPAVLAGEGQESIRREEQVEELLQHMSPEEKIGQMFMVGFAGENLDEGILSMLQQRHIGGIILYDRNMKSKAQVKALTKALQDNAQQPVPLLISTDEEGGAVARMKQTLAPAPSEADIGATENPAEAERWAVYMAQNLQELGINLNFAPVADLGPEKRGRAFSADPAKTAAFVEGAAKGYRQQNMLFTLKHFPGLGKSRVNTHVDTYLVQAPVEQLFAEDMLPFRSLIAAQPEDSFFIMVNHLHYASLDAASPASLSYKVVTGQLRERLGWQGVIITDDMEMGAISKYYSMEERGIQAVNAGVDIVLMAHVPEHQKLVYDSMLQALQDGRIAPERVDDSVRRILRAKLMHLMPRSDL